MTATSMGWTKLVFFTFANSLLTQLGASRLVLTGVHAPGWVFMAQNKLQIHKELILFSLDQNNQATAIRGQLTFGNWFSFTVDSGDRTQVIWPAWQVSLPAELSPGPRK